VRTNFSIGAVIPTATVEVVDTAVVVVVDTAEAVVVDSVELAVEIECPTSAQA
jgi:hypothetical protein